jgi:hypothetical protein
MPDFILQRYIAAAKQLQLTESSFVNRTYILNMLQRMRDLCEKNETCRRREIDGGLDCVFVNDSF